MALRVNSHYKMPWIVWAWRSQFTVNAGDELIRAVSHNLPFIPLIFGQWSTNAQFNPSYDLGVTIPGGSTGGQPETMFSVNASASSIHFDILNNASTSRTFYFKLMGFAPPGYIGQVTPVQYDKSSTGGLTFNSHYRYQQILMSGQSSGVVNHNLGYLPQAKVWAISTGRVLPAMGVLTTTNLSLASGGAFYYHIYKEAF